MSAIVAHALRATADAITAEPWDAEIQARAGKAWLTLILGPLADVSEETRERLAFAMHALAYDLEHNPEHD